jgi:hypothetical protein
VAHAVHQLRERRADVTGNRQCSDHVEWCWPGRRGGGTRQVW